MEIDDLLAERQSSEFQIEVFSYYNKMDYKPVTQLSPAAYEKWITTITMSWLTQKSASCWSKIKMASALNEKMSNFCHRYFTNMISMAIFKRT